METGAEGLFLEGWSNGVGWEWIKNKDKLSQSGGNVRIVRN